MSNKFFQILIFLLFINSSIQNCEKGKNFCILCELVTDLCKKCESDIFKPDEYGGCIGAKICNMNQNHCQKCSSSYLCETCDDGYFPDDNGGCSLTENCDVSENGDCKKCIEDYALIYSGKNYMECKAIDIYCEEFDLYGNCLNCKEGYYLNTGDKKCSKTENCLKSTEGICDACDYQYYLDKSNQTNYLCKSNREKNIFLHCSISENGENCDKCLEPYFLTEDNKCIKTKNCEKGITGTDQCQECSDDYYLSEDKYACTITENCKTGYGDNGKCKSCLKGYYNDLNDGKCYSNKEDNQYKYCLTVLDNCQSCIDDYYLGEDKKCSNTKNCATSDLGICNECISKYYLGKNDHKCTDVENCIQSDFNYNCEECDDNYFVNNNVCISDTIQGDVYKNCKIVYYGQEQCSKCKNNYYLKEEDHLCYSNEKEFPKCSRVSNGNCVECENLYYLGDDNKCSKIAGCAKSKDENTCIECFSSLCKNNQKGTCEQSFYIEEEYKEDENNGVCFRCQETNEEGTKCIKCQENYTLSKEGYCMDLQHCEQERDGYCLKCIQKEWKDGFLKSYCVNNRYGCVETVDGCKECDDFYRFNACTKCLDGFYFDSYYEFCYECKDGCTSCTNYQDCGKCTEDGYYTISESTTPETYDAICEECIEGCKTCINNLDCEVCYDGYYLNNQNSEGLMKCSSCGTFCEECYDGDYCLKCSEGFELVSEGTKIICQYKQSSEA